MPPNAPTTLRMTVAAGPDTGRAFELPPEVPITIGRGADQQVQLNDGAVSRRHLVLLGDGDAVRVEGIPGVNPPWTLREGRRQPLAVGDRLAPGVSITLGNTTLTVAAGAAPEPVPAPGPLALDAHDTGGTTRLRSLAALGDRLARCGSLQAAYRTACSWAVEALHGSRALLLSPDASDVLGAASTGPLPDLAMSRSLLRRVLSERRAFLVRDVLSEPDLADRRSVQVRGIQGAMAAPSRGLVFYVEWGAPQAAVIHHGEADLDLLVCAAQLVDALGESAVERRELRSEARATSPGRPARMVGGSAPMKRLQVFLERVAGSDATVLLIGESGTGKEVAASRIHTESGRSQGPFVAINCAAIAQNLLESELFGHEKGAFTGAVAQHKGVFERAHKGTLFLDEIGEMSLPTQARMLRVLESRCFSRVGGTGDVNVDVRLVAATHRDLPAMVQEGSFRQDLLYRLSVIQTKLPALRERVEDIEPLVVHFAESLGDAMGRRIESVHPEALAVLQRYPWPGNVRELRNVVERALVLGDGPELTPDDLPPELAIAAPAPASTGAGLTLGPDQVLPLAELERQAIAAALAATGGNKARAAALLGIDRTTLYRKLKA